MKATRARILQEIAIHAITGEPTLRDFGWAIKAFDNKTPSTEVIAVRMDDGATVTAGQLRAVLDRDVDARRLINV